MWMDSITSVRNVELHIIKPRKMIVKIEMGTAEMLAVMGGHILYYKGGASDVLESVARTSCNVKAVLFKCGG